MVHVSIGDCLCNFLQGLILLNRSTFLVIIDGDLSSTLLSVSTFLRHIFICAFHIPTTIVERTKEFLENEWVVINFILRESRRYLYKVHVCLKIMSASLLLPLSVQCDLLEALPTRLSFVLGPKSEGTACSIRLPKSRLHNLTTDPMKVLEVIGVMLWKWKSSPTSPLPAAATELRALLLPLHQRPQTYPA